MNNAWHIQTDNAHLVIGIPVTMINSFSLVYVYIYYELTAYSQC